MDQFKKDNPNAKKWVTSPDSSSPTSQLLNHQSAVSPTSIPNSNSQQQQQLLLRGSGSGSRTALTKNCRFPRVTAHYADVSDPESVQACVDEILAQHGRIDSLVTSAGFTENFQATDYPIDRFRKLFAVNVDGTYLFATAVARHLMARNARGSMVFIGSMSGAIVNVPQPQAPYNSAKAAVRHMAASLAVEWAHLGIRVNCISPGYMLTALTKKILDDNPDLKQKWTSLIPQGKMGSPEDLMGPVAFLLSDAANYVTGADLRVDGGYTVT